MKTKHIAALLIDGMKTVGVRFRDTGKVYTYKTLDDYEVGDFAVVFTPRNTFDVVMITRVDKVPQIDVDSGLSYKWLVQRIDATQYDSLVDREQEFNNKLLEVQASKLAEQAKAALGETLGLTTTDISHLVEDLNDETA